MTALSPAPGSFQIDATVGGGGHARRILEANSPDGRLLGLDADQAAVARTGRQLADFASRLTLRQANFEQIGEVAAAEGFQYVDGVLFDLGLSSYQLADEQRAFSFRAEGPLDMRFDTSRGTPAAQLLAELPEGELADIIWRYGEERHSRRIARAIVAARTSQAVRTGRQLAELVEQVVPRPRRGQPVRIHPATRVFQALRIHVNRELETLPRALQAAVELLGPDGRLAVISYHSLEDRIVKRFLAAERRGCICPPELPVCTCGHQPRLAPLSSRAQRPSPEEVARNPRSRSARLRAARRLAA